MAPSLPRFYKRQALPLSQIASTGIIQLTRASIGAVLLYAEGVRASYVFYVYVYAPTPPEYRVYVVFSLP